MCECLRSSGVRCCSGSLHCTKGYPLPNKLHTCENTSVIPIGRSATLKQHGLTTVRQFDCYIVTSLWFDTKRKLCLRQNKKTFLPLVPPHSHIPRKQ